MIFQLANHRNPNSLAARLRRKRFEEFKLLTDSVPRPMNILDVGGSQGVWETIGFVGRPDVEITLINIDPMQTSGSNIRNVVGDARMMPQFRDNEFDLVFSNSVIEHVGGPDDMKRLADEIRRVGRRYFIQTPNRYFPIEPHFVFPLFQFLPISVQTTLVQNFRLGWIPKMPERADAEREVRSIRLLSQRELKGLFPDGVVVSEKLLGVPKCLLAYKI
jgi:2-polyprenyl-3-methyl-5-hydroxy-6-metoxy-1,4-benzoquinol methylase